MVKIKLTPEEAIDLLEFISKHVAQNVPLAGSVKNVAAVKSRLREAILGEMTGEASFEAEKMVDRIRFETDKDAAAFERWLLLEQKKIEQLDKANKSVISQFQGSPMPQIMTDDADEIPEEVKYPSKKKAPPPFMTKFGKKQARFRD